MNIPVIDNDAFKQDDEIKTKKEKEISNLQTYDLFIQAPVGFGLLKGADHVIVLANTAFLKLTGRDESIIGKSMLEIFKEIESQGYLELLNRVLKYKQPIFLNESPATFLKDGIRETFYINTVLQPYYEGNEIAGILSILSDVTDLVLTRKKAEEAEQKARLAIESARLGVYEGNIVTNEINGDERFYELFGFNTPVLWHELISAIHPDDVSIREKAHKESLITGRLFYETRVVYKNKSLRWLKIYGKIFYNDQHQPVKLLGITEDITADKELDQQKDNFLSMASHELKTPLTTTKAYGQIAETLLEEKGDKQTLSMVKKMGTQLNKLTTLIEDLLDITKIQQGKLVYNETFFNFNNLVKEVIDDMQKSSSTHHIKNDAAKSIEIFGDKDKIGQVLKNLLSNAVKYSPGKHEIIVSTNIKEDGVELSVSDDGIGIPANEQQHVFEQFYRVSDGGQSTFPGMGIGLFICAEIIKRHKGKIWVESDPGKGSTFYIRLPFDHRK